MLFAFSSPLLALAYPIVVWFAVIPVVFIVLSVSFTSELKKNLKARKTLVCLVCGNVAIGGLLLFADDILLWWLLLAIPLQLFALLQLAKQRRLGAQRLNTVLQVALMAIVTSSLLIGIWSLIN